MTENNRQEKTTDTLSSKYSLWIIPPKIIYNELEGIIKKLSNRFGTPLFPPHITIVADINKIEKSEIIIKTLQLCNHFERFYVTLSGVGLGNDYFHSVFINVNSDILLKIIEKSSDLFVREDGSSYAPHLSLLYGKIDIAEQKEAVSIIGKLQYKFLVTRLYLFNTPGDIQEWNLVAKFPLDKSTKRGDEP